VSADLRFGRWQDTLADIAPVAAVITDPPYTSRVEFGYRSGTMIKNGVGKAIRKPTIPYAAITETDAVEFAAWATAKAQNWIVAFNDHIGWKWLADAIESRGWYVFSPVVWLARNSTPRFCGDGPNDSCEYIVVARPRKVVKCGSLPGYYDVMRMSSLAGESESLVGQKPLQLMQAIVRDYTSHGGTVCDPYAGSGSTLRAAVIEGRRAIGSEMDRQNFDKASKRLARGYTPRLFVESAAPPEQLKLGEP
jgi:hypothetical protein